MNHARFGRHVLAAGVACLIAPPIAAQEGPAPVIAAAMQTAPAGYQSALYSPQDKDERGLWLEADEAETKLRTSNFVIRDPALNAYVHRVFCRTVGPDCEGLRLYLMRTPYFNATTAPNGVIQVWSGLFLRTRDEAQLAAVLAHEYTHYRQRHMIKIWRELKSKSGAAVFSMMLMPILAFGLIGDIYEFSREQETEADAGSVALLAKAGYDPMAASRIWEQIGAEQDATAEARKLKSRKNKNGGMFATHPRGPERMAALKLLADQNPVAGAQLNRAEYRAALAPLWASFIDDQIKLNDFGATEFLLANLAREGWTPELNYARGELYRARGRPEDLTAAIGFYKQATADPAVPAEAWRGLGLALLRTGAQDDGKAALSHYLAVRPEAADKAMIAMLAGG